LEGIPTQSEYRILTKEGNVRWIYVHRRPEWDESGQKVIGFYGAAQDITDRKKLEIQLAYQAILLQNVSDAVISADAEWNFKTWNKGAERMYGWTEEEVIGKNVFQLFRTEYYDDTTSEEAIQDFLEKGQWAGEGLHRRKDGTQLPVHISSSPVRDKSGQIIGTVAIVRDYTASKESENQRLEIALQQERIQLLEELIADLSHDLKTPLTGITTMVYLIQKNPDPSKQAHYLDKLEVQVQRLSDLLDAILTMSRLDKGSSLTFAPLAIKSLISDIHTQVHHLLAEKNLTMSLDLSDSLPPIMGNETELNRAFANLIVNAINYTPPGGSIDVHTYQEDARVYVAIHDTGMGIARDELPRIFDRFYRVDGARNTDQGGTGLGLAIVKRIVELHSGQIQVDSEPGSGSTFCINLPTAPHPDA
jgi:PAS domain S-box-containing protein